MPLPQPDTWIFDLDNTLYPATNDLFSQINCKMNTYMSEKLGVSLAGANTIRQGFYEKYGTTLNGLMSDYGLAPEPFLEFVHDIDLTNLEPAPDLKHLLATLPGRCLVHTNGTADHARRVLARLGLSDRFEGIFDIVASQFRPKPGADAFARFIDAFDVTPARAIMFEDKHENLAVPHDLGMTTVWVNLCSPREAVQDLPHVHHQCEHVGHYLAALNL